MDDMDDMDKVQGTGDIEGYRNRLLWGCACSYLLPLILLIVYIVVRLRYGMPIIPFLR